MLLSSVHLAFAIPVSVLIDNQTINLGLAVQSAPDYSGSAQSSNAILPVIQGRNNHWFADITRGIGYGMVSSTGWYLEQTLGYSLGRDDDDNTWRDSSHFLQGMGAIPPAFTAATLIGYQIMPGLWTEVLLSKTINHTQGITFTPAIDTALPLSQEDTLLLHARLLAASAQYTQLFYGVSQTQSQQTTFTAYQTASGLYGHQLSFEWIHSFTPAVNAVLQLSYQHLSDKVAGSPIITNSDSLTTTLAMIYTF